VQAGAKEARNDEENEAIFIAFYARKIENQIATLSLARTGKARSVFLRSLAMQIEEMGEALCLPRPLHII